MTDRSDRLPAVVPDLPEDVGERLWSAARLIKVAPGKSPISQGSASNSVYIVIKGRLQVTLFSLSGREVILGELAEGEIFGELAAIDGQPRSASVIALSDCLLACVDAETFREATTDLPSGARWLAGRLAAHVRRLTTKLFESSTLPVRSRLHCELLRLCSDADTGESRIVIERAPTHAALASRVGTHREAVTREMNFLAQRGILHQEGRRLSVLDRLALARLVHEATGEQPGRE